MSISSSTRDWTDDLGHSPQLDSTWGGIVLAQDGPPLNQLCATAMSDKSNVLHVGILGLIGESKDGRTSSDKMQVS